MIEPSKKTNLGVAVRWLKRKHIALFFLSSFLRSPRRGICHRLWKRHKCVRALERTGKLPSSLFYHQCSLSVETDYDQMLIGFDFQNFCTTFSSLGIFLPPQCWNTTVLLVSSSWVAPPLATVPRTSTRDAAQTAQHIVRNTGCRTVNHEAEQRNTYFINEKIWEPYGIASRFLFVQLPRDFTYNLLPKTNKYLEEICLPYAMMSINLSPNFKISMFQQLCSSS